MNYDDILVISLDSWVLSVAFLLYLIATPRRGPSRLSHRILVLGEPSMFHLEAVWSCLKSSLTGMNIEKLLVETLRDMIL